MVMLLPALWAISPSQGAARTVALRPVPLSAIVNAVVAAGGSIVAARGSKGLIVAGRRDRLTLALLPLGVLALPTTAAGCAPGGEG